MVKYDLKAVVKSMFGYDLYTYQLKFLLDCMNHQRVVGAFCRQTGKSLTISILAMIEALKNPGGHIIIVAPTDRQAGELFEKIKLHVQNAPVASVVRSFTQREMLLKNMCRISAFPCGDDGTNIRGMTANVLIIEEAAFVKDSIVNQVLLPFVASTDGKIIKISTPFGMNHFYKSFQEDTNYKAHRYTWEDAVRVGHFTEEFVEEQRMQCSSLEFRTEYEAEFIQDEDAYFPHGLIESCAMDYPLLEETSSVVNASSSYVLGCDLARMGQDSSVFLVIERGSPNRVVFIKELKKNTMDQAIDYIKFLHNKFRFKKIVCDQTGLGAGVVDVLSRDLNRGVKIKPTSYNQNLKDNDVVIGLNFTVKTKEDIFSNLKLHMEKHTLEYPKFKPLIYQLKDFRYEISASGHLKLHHSEGGHDDFVDALACAAHGLRQREASIFFA